MDINNIRKEIDKVDDELYEVFKKRIILTREIAKTKGRKEAGKTDIIRENNILERLSKKDTYIFPYIEDLYEKVFEISKEIQRDEFENEKKCGLVGKKLSHSFSKYIHNELGDKEYSLFEVEERDLEKFLKRKDIKGINVTIPYKKKIMKYLTSIDDTAKKLDCVNTVLFKGNERIGFNTDYFGLSYAFKEKNIDLKNKNILIIGNGASAKMAKILAEDEGASIINMKGRYDELSMDMLNAEIIIQGTPVGMYPNNGNSLIDIGKFKKVKFIMELIYNPQKTKLILDGKSVGIKYSSGLNMLIAQAVRAREIFDGREISDKNIKSIYEKLLRLKGNIILIGMPGSGKTTLGQELAKIIEKKFIDIDWEIEKKIGNIEDFIDCKGEEAFRDIEENIVSKIGKKQGLIISTGGGVVTREKNYQALAQNGKIYFLDTKIEDLSTKNRPLSRNGIKTLKKLEEERRPLYLNWSEKTIKRDSIKNMKNIINKDYYAYSNN